MLRTSASYLKQSNSLKPQRLPTTRLGVLFLIKNIEKYAFQGAFVKLDEYLEEYAPNITKYLNDHPEKKANITSADGHIYIIPRFEDGDTAQGWYIRQDWLDKLGLEQPKTVDEYYKVLIL